MNKNIMIVLAGGFLIAVLVALVVQASLSGGKKPQVAESTEKVRIVVAAKRLSIGDELSEGNLKFQQWPKDAAFEGLIRQKDGKKPHELVEGTVRRPIAEGEPVMKSALVPEGRYNYMTASLAPGMRAYSIKFDADDLAGGFVKPGDYVDVLLTYRANVRYRGQDTNIRDMVEANLVSKATETILQNVKIIAVGQEIEREEAGGGGEGGAAQKKAAPKTAKAAIVTFEVDRKAAETLAVSNDLGKLSLALRKLGDETVIAERSPSTTDARVTSIYDEILEKVYRMEKSTSQASNIVRIYSGVDIEEVTVGQ